MLAQLVRAVVRRTRPRLVAYSLTDDPVVQALVRATDVEAVVAVYDDDAAPYATAATLERELDASMSQDRKITLPSIPAHEFSRTRRPVQACTLADADPPVVLLSRRSLRDWNEQARNFVLAHEFGHLCADAPRVNAVVESLLPVPDRSALTVRALVEAHGEYRAGEEHAAIRAELSERHAPPDVMAEYHAAERVSEDAVVLSPGERRAVAIRNAAKYLPLPYDPPEVGDAVRAALRKPLPRYLEWVVERPAETEASA